jgi:hypothetical protein
LDDVFTMFAFLRVLCLFHHSKSKIMNITNTIAMMMPAILPLDVLDFFLEDLDFAKTREVNCRNSRA